MLSFSLESVVYYYIEIYGPLHTGTGICTYVVLSHEYLVLPPQLWSWGGVRLLSLQACMQTASHSRYIVIFSSENMMCGPWVALFSAYWASGSLLGILDGSDGLRLHTLVAWIIAMYTSWFHLVLVTEYTCMLTLPHFNVIM
jgi:hypothetical protein